MAKKVLVVDDDPIMIEIIRSLLTGAGFEVAVCDNGSKAFDAIVTSQPDLLILDVMLPGLDGYSLQVKLAAHERASKVPIVVLTALEPAKILFDGCAQVVGFLLKPFKGEALVEMVEKAIGRSWHTSAPAGKR